MSDGSMTRRTGTAPARNAAAPTIVVHTAEGGAVITDATKRFRCVHEFVGHQGFFRCERCAFRIVELPLAPRRGLVLHFKPRTAAR